MKIAMVGAGYVGLVSGACLADFGHEVVCIDKDPAKIASLREGVMPIFEPGLAELVAVTLVQPVALLGVALMYLERRAAREGHWANPGSQPE